MTVKGQRDAIARLVASQTPNKLIYLELTKHPTKMLSHPSIKLDGWEIEATGEIQSFFVIEPLLFSSADYDPAATL